MLIRIERKLFTHKCEYSFKFVHKLSWIPFGQAILTLAWKRTIFTKSKILYSWSCKWKLGLADLIYHLQECEWKIGLAELRSKFSHAFTAKPL